MMEIIAIVIMFLGFIAFREWTNYKHIQDLETKLIARNASEYLTYKKAEKPQPSQDDVRPKQDLVDVSGLNFEDFERVKRGEA